MSKQMTVSEMARSGGLARAKALSPEERSRIAFRAGMANRKRLDALKTSKKKANPKCKAPKKPAPQNG